MTKNDDGTLCVQFSQGANNAYPLAICITDSNNQPTYLYIRLKDIDSVLGCLWSPMSPDVRFVTMTGDYKVRWWDHSEVAITNTGTRKAVVLQWREAMELCTMVRHEMGKQKMPVINLKKEEVGVGIEGRLDSPVRLKLGDLDSSFGIKTADAHKLIAFIGKHPLNVTSSEELTIESTRGTLEVQFIDKESLAIENTDDRMLMILDQGCFEELHRVLTLTVPKLQEFVEKNWVDSVNKQVDDNLRGVFE